jgi:hypothetical protein
MAAEAAIGDYTTKSPLLPFHEFGVRRSAVTFPTFRIQLRK